MITARDKFEKFLGESPTYSTCRGRYVNHEVNERWKVWQHQQKIIDELERKAESEFRKRFEDGWCEAAVKDDHDRLVRRLDVALNGEYGAAKQASLCDIVAQVESGRYPVLEAVKACNVAFDELFGHCVSNGVFNVWQQPMNCTNLNDAVCLVSRVMREVKP